MTQISMAAEETGSNPFIPADYDIIWSIIPFAIILAVFWFFVVPTFRRILDDRAAVIEGGIAKAESAQAEAAEALAAYNLQLAEGRAEAARIRETARTEGAQILAELKEQASVESARILANAQVLIEAERQAALVSLRAEVGSLAIDLASGVIGASMSDDAQASAIVDRFLAELESSENSNDQAKA
ncbi:ATP synthase F0 subcomplex B subunit [Glaciihabitans tibetensis]|uniref:ATP synthase subunit b n=1 Tax=Glaciihabitans tibetensis TaxID=1266600 RepID=A0A2T0VHB6_9MICO|nr:F0F1 ATP synthase subunit B [Glaciihabitans tibetensis]PRY69602.1 ATP synthase F0 subcomplex B subunit [Glaciihabitans tibetensis]